MRSSILSLLALAALVSANNGPNIEPVPSLLQIRDVLASYESAIIHAVLSRSVYQANSDLASEEQWQVKQLLHQASVIDQESRFPSVASTVPDPIFSTDSLPYLDFERNSWIGALFGDNAAEDEPSVWDYTFSSLYPANDSTALTSLTHSLPLSTSSFSVLSLVSSRISNAEGVALAKLYDARAAPTNTSATPNATVCGYLKNNDVENVRGFLTDLKQVASVRSSVTNKTETWVNKTGSLVDVTEWVPKVVGLFNM